MSAAPNQDIQLSPIVRGSTSEGFNPKHHCRVASGPDVGSNRLINFSSRAIGTTRLRVNRCFRAFGQQVHQSVPSVRRAAGVLGGAIIGIIKHDSRAKVAWDWLIIVAILYTSIIIPFEAAFVTSEDARKSGGISYMQTLAVVDVIISAIFVIDMALTFRTSFVDERGMTICQYKSIATRYIKGWFTIDALSLLPFDLILFAKDTNETVLLVNLLKNGRIPRLLRITRKMDAVAISGEAVLSLMIASFIVFAHWLGCMFYALAIAERPFLPDPKIGWVDSLAEAMNKPINDSDPLSGPDIKSRYLASLDFAISCLTNIGLGNTSPNTNLEKIFSIFMMLVGSLLYTAIIRNVNSLASAYSSHGSLRKQKKILNEFVRLHKIPQQLRDKLKEGFRKAWSITHGQKPAEVFRDFPDHLLADLEVHLDRALWTHFEAFKGVGPGCLREVAIRTTTLRVPTGHQLVHYGDVVDGLFFITRGYVEVTRQGKVVTILGPGDAMGEGTYQSDELRTSTCDAKAATYCDVHKILLTDLVSAFQCYPEFSENFWKTMLLAFGLCQLDASGDEASETAGWKNEAILTRSSSLTLKDFSTHSPHEASAIQNEQDAVKSHEHPNQSNVTGELQRLDESRFIAVDIHSNPEHMESHRPSASDERLTHSSTSCLVGNIHASSSGRGACHACCLTSMPMKLTSFEERINKIEESVATSVELILRLLEGDDMKVFRNIRCSDV